ncbi:hypothetical protein C8R43DRAFT_1140654 [Mycena crocata]|nr:hypothetical protein C8R43DRAFT_1140654 [Mycena crocata]
MSSQVDVSLPTQEDADMAKCSEFHKAEEEELSLWPLDDEPFLWFKAEENLKPDWDTDPEKFTLLWAKNRDIPIQIPGPHIPTNLFGRTVAEVFADFPTDFYDTPSPPSSPALSPASPVFSPSPIHEANTAQLPHHAASDPLIDEVSQQLADRIHINSPPQSPRPVPTFELSPHDDTAPPPLSPSTCNPLSVNSLSDTFSSSSSTLSVGTLSTTPSTYAFSPSPKPFSSSSSSPPAPGLRRSPRRSPSAHIPDLSETREQYSAHRYPILTVPPVKQVILEEYPLDAARRQKSSKRSGSYSEDGADERPTTEVDDLPPRKKLVRAAPKRHSCTVPGCTESFTRPNDVLRHIKNAAIHKGTTQQAEALAASSTLCKYCGEELSRADAARRHELKASCGKRTIRRKSTYSMLPAELIP